MVTCQVNSGSLSSLMDTRGCIELIAEPYRLQRDVVLGVPYSEYVTYIQALPEDSSITLLSGTKQTIRSCTAKDPTLYNAFLCDVAFAICKELFYSERCGEDATVIVPIKNGPAPMAVSKFLRIATISPFDSDKFEKLLAVHNHSQRIRSERNKQLKQLALALYSLSCLGNIRGELGLTYDLDQI